MHAVASCGLSDLVVSPYRHASVLKASLRRLCTLSHQRTIALNQRCLFWEFVENIAVARAVGVDQAFIEAIDKKVDAMGRQQVIELALAHAVALPPSAFSVRDNREKALVRYFRLAAALDWLVDSAAYTAARLSDDVVRQFSRLDERVRLFRAALREHADAHLVGLWSLMHENGRSAFVPPLFDRLVSRC